MQPGRRSQPDGRSRVVRCALGAAAVALVWCAARAGSPASSSGDEPACWSVQLHLHGPFSEGLASIDSHSYEGRDVGVDVLWWSEHDYRISSFHMLTGFSFDALELPLHDEEDWQPLGPWEQQRSKRLDHLGTRGAGARWEIVDDGERRALLVAAAGVSGAAPTQTLLELTAEGASQMRSLAAEVELELWVRAAACSAESRGVIELSLSEHAPRADLGLEPCRLRYSLGPEGGEPLRTGATLEVPLAVPPDTWTRLVLPVTRDVVAGFPFLVGEDNALRKLAFGVQAADETETRFLFDALEIRHARPATEMYAAQAALLGRVGAGYPDLIQMQGVELSLGVPHLNAYLPTPELELPDYERLLAAAAESDLESLSALGRALVPTLVSEVHARGGLISCNHMFGASWGIARGKSREREVLAELVEAGAYGADLLEVGYRARGGTDLAAHLRVWDRLAKAGYPLVGTGVSDSHGGPDGRWRTGNNNFVSWIIAPSTERRELLEGLRQGRVFFGDLTLFDGRLDLTSERGFTMGQIVLTDRERALVELRVEGAKPRDYLLPVLSGKESTRFPLEQTAGRVPLEVPLAADEPSVVRFELRARDGTVRALSNPIVYVRSVPPAGQVAARLALDVGGVIARALDGFTLTSASSRPADGAPLVEIAGSAQGARLVLDLTHFGALERLELEGFEGTWEHEGSRLELRDLRGSGRLRIVGAR